MSDAVMVTGVLVQVEPEGVRLMVLFETSPPLYVAKSWEHALAAQAWQRSQGQTWTIDTFSSFAHRQRCPCIGIVIKPEVAFYSDLKRAEIVADAVATMIRNQGRPR